MNKLIDGYDVLEHFHKNIIFRNYMSVLEMAVWQVVVWGDWASFGGLQDIVSMLIFVIFELNLELLKVF